MMGLSNILYLVSVWALPVLIAITFHEAAHGFVAWKLGDDTAKRQGRVTFNPIKHIDPVGTILLPVMLLLIHAPFLFGYAKPVPVNFGRLRSPRQHMVLVALAGPGINMGLAVVSTLLMNVAGLFPLGIEDWFLHMLSSSVIINLVLAVFNMIPLPPLDGGRVAVGLLPDALAIPLARLERYGFLILIGILFLLPMIGQQIGANLSVFQTVVWVPVEFLYNFLVNTFGV